MRKASYRDFFLIPALLLAGCQSGPRDAPPKPDATVEAWYGPMVAKVHALRDEAEGLVEAGKYDDAAARITEAQPLVNRLITVPRPSLAAMEGASDIDDLYARMLMRNRHFGWARMQFQKNVARWRNWTPQTDNTRRRREQAEAGMLECDRQLAR
jgi:hypothetical protein